METKRIERILIVIAILLAINLIAQLKPYQIIALDQRDGTIHPSRVCRLNVYTGDITFE